jgi:transcriptional regulator with XRE-family HTH domain
MIPQKSRTRSVDRHRFQDVRLLLGITQQELAAAMRVSQQLVSHIETGRAALSVATAIRLADAAKKRGHTLTLDYIYRRDARLGAYKTSAYSTSAASEEPAGAIRRRPSGARAPASAPRRP